MHSIFKKAMKYVLNRDYRFLIYAGFGCYNRWDDERYLQKKFRAVMGRELNLDAPRTFNEKLQWLKLYDRKPEYTMMVDKYAVRAYIAEKLGDQYLIPLLGVWENPDDIDFDALPDQFVLKCNHNSGLGMCICRDKSKLNYDKVRKELRKGLAQDYYLTGREWPYKNVPRKIICEKFMTDESGTELKDYKVMCFGGEPYLIQIHRGRFGSHTQDFYDSAWNKLQIVQGGIPMSDIYLEKPVFLDEMLDLSRILSAGLPQVRVDWYYANNQLYFGELTFFDASGYDDFYPDEVNYELGEKIILP